MIPMAIPPRSYSWTLPYDAECGVCQWSLAWVLRAPARNLIERRIEAAREAYAATRAYAAAKRSA
jgi:hypothetical protein